MRAKVRCLRGRADDPVGGIFGGTVPKRIPFPAKIRKVPTRQGLRTGEKACCGRSGRSDVAFCHLAVADFLSLFDTKSDNW